MATCTICGTVPYFLPLTCGCSYFCQECILSWFKEQLNGQNFSEDRPIVCPSGDTRHEISLEEVLEIAKGSSDEVPISKNTLRLSLRQLPGTVFCPKEGCDYVGWVDKKKKCSDPVECELCGEKWREEQLLPSWRRYAQLVKRLLTREDDSFSLLWKDLWTEVCPGCGVNIEKNGGCPHMNCFRCNLAFCWTCMKPTRTHDTEYCSTRLLIWTTIYTAFVALLMVKLLSLCGVLCEVLVALSLFLITVGCVGLGLMVIGFMIFQGEFWLRMMLVVLYVITHVLLVQFTDLGRHIWDLEMFAMVGLVHAGVALTFQKY